MFLLFRLEDLVFVYPKVISNQKFVTCCILNIIVILLSYVKNSILKIELYTKLWKGPILIEVPTSSK